MTGTLIAVKSNGVNTEHAQSERDRNRGREREKKIIILIAYFRLINEWNGCNGRAIIKNVVNESAGGCAASELTQIEQNR